jgi:hypothetical protein
VQGEGGLGEPAGDLLGLAADPTTRLWSWITSRRVVPWVSASLRAVSAASHSLPPVMVVNRVAALSGARRSRVSTSSRTTYEAGTGTRSPSSPPGVVVHSSISFSARLWPSCRPVASALSGSASWPKPSRAPACGGVGGEPVVDRGEPFRTEVAIQGPARAVQAGLHRQEVDLRRPLRAFTVAGGVLVGVEHLGDHVQQTVGIRPCAGEADRTGQLVIDLLVMLTGQPLDA